jgi:hypothetical protein
LRYYIASDHLRKLVVDIIKVIGKLDVDSFVVEQAPYVQAKLEKKKKIESSR